MIKIWEARRCANIDSFEIPISWGVYYTICTISSDSFLTGKADAIDDSIKVLMQYVYSLHGQGD